MTYHAFHLTSTPGSKSLILNAPDVFLKRRGVSVKTSGRFKKTSGFPKIGKDLFTYSQNNTSETFYFSYYKFLFSSLEI
jgi:hypothetical protein